VRRPCFRMPPSHRPGCVRGVETQRFSVDDDRLGPSTLLRARGRDRETHSGRWALAPTLEGRCRPPGRSVLVRAESGGGAGRSGTSHCWEPAPPRASGMRAPARYPPVRSCRFSSPTIRAGAAQPAARKGAGQVGQARGCARDLSSRRQIAERRTARGILRNFTSFVRTGTRSGSAAGVREGPCRAKHGALCRCSR
jgi:hypothetical protein